MRKIKVGDEIIVKKNFFDYLTYGKSYRVNNVDLRHFTITSDDGVEAVYYLREFDVYFEFAKSESTDEAPKHYDNSNGSLYLFADKQGLNTWEFDIVKRIVRCRKKGNFREDLEKTKFLIDLYLKEWMEN